MLHSLLLVGAVCFTPFPEVKAATNATFTTQQHAVKVTGNVVDAKGESIIGASVMVKNTTIGVITDLMVTLHYLYPRIPY